MAEEVVKDLTPIFTEDQLSAMGESIKGGAFYEILRQNSKQIREAKHLLLQRIWNFVLRMK